MQHERVRSLLLVGPKRPVERHFHRFADAALVPNGKGDLQVVEQVAEVVEAASRQAQVTVSSYRRRWGRALRSCRSKPGAPKARKGQGVAERPDDVDRTSRFVRKTGFDTTVASGTIRVTTEKPTAAGDFLREFATLPFRLTGARRPFCRVWPTVAASCRIPSRGP
jgi:hypothetical protein